MKTNALNSLFLIGVLGAAMMLSACQTAPQYPTSAITCSKCKTVWVSTPGGGGKPGSGYYALRSSKQMVCPGCQDAILTFLRTGQLKHHCNICGGTLDHCTAH